MKKGTHVAFIRRNGEKVKAVVIGSRASSRGDWVTLRVGEKGAAGTYEIDARPGKCTVIISKEK